MAHNEEKARHLRDRTPSNSADEARRAQIARTMALSPRERILLALELSIRQRAFERRLNLGDDDDGT